MTYFTFNGEHENDENFRVNVSFQAETLNDVLENFKLFLRGVGYSVDNLIVFENLKPTNVDLGEVNLSGLNLNGSTTSYSWDPAKKATYQSISALTTEQLKPLTIADLEPIQKYSFTSTNGSIPGY